MTKHYESLWCEKYRPKILKDIILSPENRERFETLGEDTPHLLFYGSPGIGKSTLAKIIVNDILKCQYLYINASDENGIDTIRNKVISFAQTQSIDGKKKVVILEEFDNMSGDAHRILRNVMEEYEASTRFILTANYFNKIIEPIRSRCMLIKLQTDISSFAARCLEILKEEKVVIDANAKAKISTFFKERYPDFRRTINDLQLYSVSGTLVIPERLELSDLASTLVKDLVSKTPALELRKKVIESEKTFNNDFQLLFKEMFNHIYESSLPDKTKRGLLVDIGEYMYRDSSVLDHEINFFCCLLALEATIN